MKARLIGVVNGKRAYRVPVTVSLNSSQLCRTVVDLRFEVIAHTAAEAANWARDQFSERPETEIVAYGPQGGRIQRYVGWQSAIWAALCSRPRGQRSLF